MSNEAFEAELTRLCDGRFQGEHKQYAREDFERVARRVLSEFCESTRVMRRLFKASYVRAYLNGWHTGAGWAIAQEFREFDITPWDIEGLFVATDEVKTA